MKILLVFIVIIISVLLFRWRFGVQATYHKYVQVAFSRVHTEQDIIKAEDLSHLPNLVKKYLEYVGIVGKERVTHFKVVFDGQMRLKKDSDWVPISAEQHTFLSDGIRLFLIDMKYKDIVVNGLHHFNKEDASMVIKILDIIKVVNHSGEIMKKAETVTYFNDICILAPGALIDNSILWETIDDRTVKGTMTLGGVTVSATLSFDDLGRLVNFISEDRYAILSDGSYKKMPWSTPMSEYKILNGLNLPVVGEAVWHYEEGDFSYIKLNVKDVIVNP